MSSLNLRITPKYKRQATVDRVSSIVRQVPRCAALTAKGEQCTGTGYGAGRGGGTVEVEGEEVHLCATHYHQ